MLTGTRGCERVVRASISTPTSQLFGYGRPRLGHDTPTNIYPTRCLTSLMHLRCISIHVDAGNPMAELVLLDHLSTLTDYSAVLVVNETASDVMGFSMAVIASKRIGTGCIGSSQQCIASRRFDLCCIGLSVTPYCCCLRPNDSGMSRIHLAVPARGYLPSVKF